MADNFIANAGSGGSTFAADDISSVLFPRTKIVIGADGTNDGDVSSANPMPITGTVTAVTSITNDVSIADGGNSITVDNGGTFAVQAGQSGTWNVTNISGTVSLPTGAATAANQTTGNGHLATLAGAVAGTEVQVDIVASLPAGTNAIGKLAANDGVDIGDVDVTSIAAGTNTVGGVIAQQSTSAAYDGTTSCELKRADGVATASGANTMVAAVTGKKIRVLSLAVLPTTTSAWAITAFYLYNGDNTMLGDSSDKLRAGMILPFNPAGWIETDTANELLGINLGSADPVVWALTYIEVD